MHSTHTFWVFSHKSYGKCFIKYNIIWIRYDTVRHSTEKFLNVKFSNLISFLSMNTLRSTNTLHTCNYIYEYITCESKKGEILHRTCTPVRDKPI